MTAIRLLVIATALARTSGGGRSYLEGLFPTLHLAGAELVVVVPSTEAAWVRARAPYAELVEVAPETGIRRIARDLLTTQRWARDAGADVVVHPNDLQPKLDRPLVTVVQNVGPFHPASRAEFGVRGAAYRRHLRSDGARVIVHVSETARVVAGLDQAREQQVVPEAVLVPEQWRSGPRDGLAIVTGPAEYKDPSGARRLAERLRASGELVELLGGPGPALPRSTFLARLASARAVVCTSTVESFGLPAIEAACLGARPIVRHGSAMTEHLADVAVVVDDLDEVVSLVRGLAPLPDVESARVRERFSPRVVSLQWRPILDELAL